MYVLMFVCINVCTYTSLSCCAKRDPRRLLPLQLYIRKLDVCFYLYIYIIYVDQQTDR